jgi:hypothetical protein
MPSSSAEVTIQMGRSLRTGAPGRKVLLAFTLAFGLLAGCSGVDIIHYPGTPFTPEAPTINVPPASQSVTVGGTATFNVVASGTQPLSYQWYKLEAGASAPDAIPGAQNASYVYGGAQLADSGAKITVVITNIVGTKTSDPATLTVRALPPSIVQQPQPQSVLVGARATFSVAANGTAPLHFQWMKNGVAIPGANSASYLTPPTTLADSGSLFDVVVNNASGSSPRARPRPLGAR